MNRHRHNFGFTLIELVLALAMVAVVAMTLYETMKIAFKATSVADAAIVPSRSADLAMEVIGNDLQNSVTPNVATTFANAQNITDITGGTGFGNTSNSSSSSSAASTGDTTGWVLAGPFEGQQGTSTGPNEIDDLTFFTTADSPEHPDGNGEIKMVELTAAVPQGSASTDLCLVRRVTNNLLPTAQTITPDEEILCRGITGVSFQYFDGTNWNPSWDSTEEDNDLPAAVQVTLTLQTKQTNGQTGSQTYTRVFPLSCSTAALDPEVNTTSQ
jgi:prepilin-type N-terminal cleavage/methylation domain-containing protein